MFAKNFLEATLAGFLVVCCFLYKKKLPQPTALSDFPRKVVEKCDQHALFQRNYPWVELSLLLRGAIVNRTKYC